MLSLPVRLQIDNRPLYKTSTDLDNNDVFEGRMGATFSVLFEMNDGI